MTAKNLPFFKRRLMEVSKELYFQHGWDVPKGMVDQALRNPLNFTRAEWQQAKRAMADPQARQGDVQTGLAVVRQRRHLESRARREGLLPCAR
jgi:hypothetical protein